jgi:hypothetical protein
VTILKEGSSIDDRRTTYVTCFSLFIDYNELSTCRNSELSSIDIANTTLIISIFLVKILLIYILQNFYDQFPNI